MASSLESVLRVSELSSQICQYLDNKTLQALSSGSKSCNSSANVFLFKQIYIRVTSRQKLQGDIDRWTRTLERTSSLGHVRCLKVNGWMTSRVEDHGQVDSTAGIKSLQDDWATDPDLTLWEEEQETPKSSDYVSVHEMIEEDDAWKPLSDFLHRLPSLTDLFYSCTNQFSPCLLNALNQKSSGHSNCRLHLQTFKFHSIAEDDIHPYELSLVTSPCLYSMSVEFHDIDIRGKLQEKATLWAVSHLAPRLKEVSIHWTYVASPKYSYQDPKTWPKSTSCPYERRETSCGNLTKLEKRGRIRLTPEALIAWEAHTRFSALRVLKLENSVDQDTLQWATQNCSFDSLSVLVLNVHPWNFNHLIDRMPIMDEQYYPLEAFLKSLPPLKKLRLYGRVIKSTIKTTVRHHGKTLRKLWVKGLPRFHDLQVGPDVVRQIQQCCPHLEELMLPIQRSKGDSNEVSIYKILGSMPKLRKLYLMLGSSYFPTSNDGEPVEASFDEFDQQTFSYRHVYHSPTLNGHVRDTLINCALDETLSRSIFRLIASQKVSGSSPLEFLKIESVGTQQYRLRNRCDLPNLIKHISRAWLVERNPSNDSHYGVITTELELDIVVNIHPTHHRTELLGDLEAIYRKLWPPKEGSSGDWRQDWHSFSLSES
ncbi:hypothetical protein F5884DRAFT_859669 [Xylogone sp. PMI_703]|nr:hypothetical protein F5884DRAFT_859669 [Xylogone sp. PMI_703]